jgi:hypothetical protein
MTVRDQDYPVEELLQLVLARGSIWIKMDPAMGVWLPGAPPPQIKQARPVQDLLVEVNEAVKASPHAELLRVEQRYYNGDVVVIATIPPAEVAKFSDEYFIQNGRYSGTSYKSHGYGIEEAILSYTIVHDGVAYGRNVQGYVGRDND